MTETENTEDCGNPRCICHRGYQAVLDYEKANDIHVETIELNFEDLNKLKEETGSWYLSNRMLVKQYYLDEGNTVFADAVQKEIDNHLARQQENQKLT